ncbi:hypothetical protein EVAR_95420_1 [Eumeta japonica]|uniref:Uncharacterized protein n=1 Tax=Eumeta variegata TaxID=151549 RepID=A0A4C1VHC6_EUMVA|nr:hypothetical protein EVAR_95420_1 [Eumeta japonica]
MIDPTRISQPLKKKSWNFKQSQRRLLEEMLLVLKDNLFFLGTTRMESFKSMLFTVEEFHLRKEPSLLYLTPVYEDTICHQNSSYTKLEVYGYSLLKSFTVAGNTYGVCGVRGYGPF